MKRKPLAALVALSIGAAGCAGRDPHYIASTAAWDQSLTCEQIQYMMANNEREIADLEIEQSNNTMHNVGWFVGGLLVWPAWLMMDIKGAQKKEIAGYRARNEVLSEQAARACVRVADST
jgi:hypothetical protein